MNLFQLPKKKLGQNFLIDQNIINKIDQLEEANILISAFELRIFSILDKRFMTAKQIANASKSQLEGIETLLNALAAMGALKKKRTNTKIPK